MSDKLATMATIVMLVPQYLQHMSCFFFTLFLIMLLGPIHRGSALGVTELIYSKSIVNHGDLSMIAGILEKLANRQCLNISAAGKR